MRTKSAPSDAAPNASERPSDPMLGLRSRVDDRDSAENTAAGRGLASYQQIEMMRSLGVSSALRGLRVSARCMSGAAETGMPGHLQTKVIVDQVLAKCMLVSNPHLHPSQFRLMFSCCGRLSIL